MKTETLIGLGIVTFVALSLVARIARPSGIPEPSSEIITGVGSAGPSPYSIQPAVIRAGAFEPGAIAQVPIIPAIPELESLNREYARGAMDDAVYIQRFREIEQVYGDLPDPLTS